MSLWLAKNQQSNEVLALQNALNLRLKPNVPLALDGIFGNHTEVCVREFQQCEGLKVDGIAGPHTLGNLFERAEITEVANIVRLTEMDPAGDAASVPNPRMPFDRRFSRPPPAREGRANPAREPTLGELMGRWQQRDALLQTWISQAPPKGAYPLVLPEPTQPAPDTALAAAVGSSRGEDAAAQPLSLHPRSSQVRPKKVRTRPSRPFGNLHLISNDWLELEAATEHENQLVREIETKFAFRMALVKLSPIVSPTASFYVNLEGRWAIQGSVKFANFPFYEHEFKAAHLGPGTIWTGTELIGSVVWEKEFGHHVGLDLQAGLRFQVEKRLGLVGRNEFLVTCGISGRAVLSNHNALYGLWRGPTLGGQIVFNVGVKYALTRRHHR